jgi:hypothetical protein
MRLVKEKSKKYKEYKKLNFPTAKQRLFIRHYERAFSKMNSFDRDFFFKVYIREGQNDWWMKYYTRYIYHRMRINVSRKFLNHFEKYEA